MKYTLFFLSSLWSVANASNVLKLPPIAYPKLSASFTANAQAQTKQAFQELRAKKECQTDWKDLKRKSSYLYRILAFEALYKCGHPYPEVVMITSDQQEPLTACAGSLEIQKKEGRGINFYEPKFKKESYGVRRLLLFHEAWHIIKKDYYKGYANLQVSRLYEQEADIEGAKRGGCEQCALEYAQFWLKRFLKNQPHIECLARDVTVVPGSIEMICAWNMGYLNWYAAQSKKTLQNATGSEKRTHPFDLERALYIVRLAKTVLVSKACEFHKPLLLEKQRKAARDKQLLDLKKLRDEIRKEREAFDAQVAAQKRVIAAIQAKQKNVRAQALKELHPSCVSHDRSGWLFTQKK
jgi:hypothetical protein